jgi:predicted RNase H-like nuclease
MRAVLGIDAAWTATQPSGVALAVEHRAGWQLTAATTSYRSFLNLTDHYEPITQFSVGLIPDADALLVSASKLCGVAVQLVAIDMPLARSPIIGRRISDDAVSIAYGSRKCGTHSPNASRPGQISTDLRISFEQAGYPLRTEPPVRPGLIEVYPHPALVELADAQERLPYKVSRVRSYWPLITPTERRTRLVSQWHQIVDLLEKEIAGVRTTLPEIKTGASLVEMKSYEDALDAVICAWIAICALDGHAKPFGDKNSAIWIPNFARNALLS